MKRLLVFTLLTSLLSGSAAFAGESLVQSAARIAQAQAAAVEADAVTNRNDVTTLAKNTALFAQERAVLSKSGLKRRNKALLYIGMGVGFAAAAYVIDHNVVNATPSSLGTRRD